MLTPDGHRHDAAVVNLNQTAVPIHRSYDNFCRFRQKQTLENGRALHRGVTTDISGQPAHLAVKINSVASGVNSERGGRRGVALTFRAR